MTLLTEHIREHQDAWRLTETAREAQIFPWGDWQHPEYGKMVFDEKFFSEMIANFDANVRGKRIPIDSEHMVDPLGAKGYIVSLRMVPGVGLFATPEWTDYGLSLLRDDRFKYFSPTFRNEWTHPQTGEKYRNVLTAAALTVDPFCLGMQEYHLSEGWHRQDVTLADAVQPEPEVKEQSFEEILGELAGIHDKVKAHIKGIKGAPGTRHQLEMVSTLLGSIAELKNKKTTKETPQMSEETIAATLAEPTTPAEVTLTDAEKEAVALKEKVALAEAALVAERKRNTELKEQARKMKVANMVNALREKNILRPGEADKFEAYALTLSEQEDATNEVRLTEGKEQVNFLNALKSIAETCFYTAEFHTSPDGVTGNTPDVIAANEAEAAKDEAVELTDTQKVKQYMAEHNVDYMKALVTMREQGLIAKSEPVIPKI